MSRRKKIPALPFDAALPLIEALEAHVIGRVVTAEFTVDEALLAMYGDDVVSKLRAAWPITRDIDRGHTLSEDIVFPVAEAATVTATVTIRANAAKILVPGPGYMRSCLELQPMIRCAQEAYEQHRNFEKVRRAIRWLNNHATVGAARHYCPWLVSVLPLDHDFHKASGHIFREPSQGLAEIMPTMRECASIMASALLAGDPQYNPKNLLLVSFKGQRDRENYASQQFGLI